MNNKMTNHHPESYWHGTNLETARRMAQDGRLNPAICGGVATIASTLEEAVAQARMKPSMSAAKAAIIRIRADRAVALSFDEVMVARCMMEIATPESLRIKVDKTQRNSLREAGEKIYETIVQNSSMLTNLWNENKQRQNLQSWTVLAKQMMIMIKNQPVLRESILKTSDSMQLKHPVLIDEIWIFGRFARDIKNFGDLKLVGTKLPIAGSPEARKMNEARYENQRNEEKASRINPDGIVPSIETAGKRLKDPNGKITNSPVGKGRGEKWLKNY